MRLFLAVAVLGACGGDDAPRCKGFDLGAAVTQAAGANAADLTLVDINRDRQLDVVYRKGSSIAVKLQFSDGTLGDAITTPMFDDVRDGERFVLGDVDGDGLLDAVVSATSGTIRVGHGHVDGTFTLVATSDLVVPADELIVDLAAGDVDGDGAADVVLATAGPMHTVWLARGDGHGAFGGSTALGGTSIESPLMVALADVSGDDLTDILVADEGFISPGDARSGGIKILTQMRGGSFGDASRLSSSARFLAVGDLDADGGLDIVADGHTTVFVPDMMLNIVYADRPEASSVLSLSAGGAVDTAPRILDMDGDGRLDILYGVDGGTGIALQLNRNNHAFYLLRQETGVSGTPSIAAGDITGDGTPDVVFTNNDQIVVLPGICE